MGEGSSENVAPPSNTESESNQMMMMDSAEVAAAKQAFGSVAASAREDSLGAPAVVSTNGHAAGVVLTDSNQMMVE